MQPVTVAISPTGIGYLLQTLLGGQIAKALENNLVVPDYTYKAPDFSVVVGENSTSYSNVTVKLTKGKFNNFTPTFSTYQQVKGDDGKNDEFSVVMSASNVDVSYTWTESGDEASPEMWNPLPFGPDTYGYDVTFNPFEVTAVFKLAVASGAYQLTYVSSSVDPGNPHPNIPKNSVLNQSNNICSFSTLVSKAVVDQLDKIDYGTCVATVLKPIFASIADSGKLGNIEFDFMTPGDSGLVFPAAGIQIGATGTVSMNGSAYPAKAPANLALPPVPTGSPAPHVIYFVQDYEVDALFWGFFQAGILKTTLTSGELSDPQALETSTYAGSSLNNLYMKYPGLLMSADLSARAAPTTAFQTIYQLTAANLAQMQAALGADVWANVGAELTNLSGTTFSSQTGFETELALVDSKLSTYAATIEQYAGTPGGVVTHTTRCILNVLQGSTSTPVITFDVAQTFVMQELKLGVSSTGTTQSVVFTFAQPLDVLPVPSFVTSTIPGVGQGDFGDVWNALRPNWQNTFAAIGKAGLPLPRIPGFDFLFQQAQVGVVPGSATADGYLSIAADVTYSPGALAPAVRRAIAGGAVLVGA